MAKLLTLKQAAEEVGFHPETLRRTIKKNNYPHYRIGGEIRVNLEELLNATRIGDNNDRCDCVDDTKGDNLCQSTNNANQNIGGLSSQHLMDKSYAALLGLPTEH